VFTFTGSELQIRVGDVTRGKPVFHSKRESRVCEVRMLNVTNGYVVSHMAY